MLDAIRRCADTLGHVPSRAEFKARSGLTEYHVLNHFPSWREAVRIAGLEPHATNVRLDDVVLLADWGALVRKIRQIPTRSLYKREGKFSPGVFESHFGPWSSIPAAFRRFADQKPGWADVVALLPIVTAKQHAGPTASRGAASTQAAAPAPQPTSGSVHLKLSGRQTYGDPVDFRGLRHVPVNEDGVVFLFGMVARELGYMVEAVQAGFPDCEAKRQVDAGRWQRVRIEFEFESRNFRDHGHAPDGCDVIVCWRHNWPECPAELEVVELQEVIKSLARSEE